MALFGKKKREATPADEVAVEPTDGANGSEDDAFDFDSIARDLDASDGPSPFDEMLAKPAQSAPADTGFEMPTDHGLADDSGFDFPVETEAEIPTIADDYAPFTTAAPVASVRADEPDFGAVFDQNASAPVPTDDIFGTPAGIDIEPIGATDEPMVAPAPPLLNTAPILTTDIQRGQGGVAVPKKSLPLVPMLGAGALLLALAGAGWWTFGRGAEPEPDVAPVSLRPRRKPKPVTAQNPPLVAPAPGVVPAGNTASPGVPPTNANLPKPKSPKVVVPPVPKAPAPKVAIPKAPIPNPAVPVVAPAVKQKLAALWKQGADAKHRKDFAGARRAWQGMLRVAPGHPGVQEAIDKLPPQKG